VVVHDLHIQRRRLPASGNRLAIDRSPECSIGLPVLRAALQAGCLEEPGGLRVAQLHLKLRVPLHPPLDIAGKSWGAFATKDFFGLSTGKTPDHEGMFQALRIRYFGFRLI
jgi:hypothetical protein